MRPYVSLHTLFAGLMSVITPAGIQASNADLYKGAIFGRDNLIVGLDLVPYYPDLSARILISVARLQGRLTNPISEEEPGRIHHEYRSLTLGGEYVGPRQIEILHDLAQRWGGSDTDLRYYGTVDATPQFVRLALAHVHHHGPEVLNVRLRRHDGTSGTIAEAVLAALEWIVARLQTSQISLLEFQRTNPLGHPYQALRDGRTAYVHEDGTLANPEAPIASLEIQGLTYDALVAGAELFPHHANAESWHQQAIKLRDQTMKHFWMADQSRFAMAIDRHPATGAIQHVATATSLPAELLDTGLFDDVWNRERYLGAIVRDMFSANFLTSVGLRMRGYQYTALLPYWDYQGSHVSWTVNSNIFARGLRRQGLIELAEVIEERYLHGLNRSRECYEFWYVGAPHQVIYRPTATPGHQAIVATNVPEHSQAWTISAALRALLASADPTPPAPGWATSLTNEILAQLLEADTASIDFTGSAIEHDWAQAHEPH